MIKSIEIRRKFNYINFASRNKAIVADGLYPKLNIISINDSGDPVPNFKNANKVLGLTETDIIDDIDLGRVTEFIESLNGESVLVHCFLGSVRSRWLTNWIMQRYNYKLDTLAELYHY